MECGISQQKNMVSCHGFFILGGWDYHVISTPMNTIDDQEISSYIPPNPKKVSPSELYIELTKPLRRPSEARPAARPTARRAQRDPPNQCLPSVHHVSDRKSVAVGSKEHH